MTSNGAQNTSEDELLNHETDLGRSFAQPRRPSLNLYRERSSLDEARPSKPDDHDGYTASKYYSTYQEPGKQMHATHGSAGDLSALDQTEDPERVSRLMNRPTSDSTKPGRSDIEELLSNPNATTSTTTTTSHSVKGST